MAEHQNLQFTCEQTTGIFITEKGILVQGQILPDNLPGGKQEDKSNSRLRWKSKALT